MNSQIVSTLLCSLFIFGSADAQSKVVQVKEVQQDFPKIINLPIDVDRSVVKWRGTEMWETGSHEGILKLREGHLEMEGGDLTGGYFIVDMHSISITDIPKSDPIPRRNLREHLKSEDFFYVEKYPTAKFKISKTEALEGDILYISGNLTLRDITKPITFKAVKSEIKNVSIAYEAVFRIDRFEWNISYQGSYWERITSIIDNNFVDADITISVQLITVSRKKERR